jgi:hypothetical protein
MVLLGDGAQVEARISPFRDSANLVQDRCTICAERTIASEIILDTPMELQGDVYQVESHSVPFKDSLGVGARLVHGLYQTYRRLRNRFRRT